MSVHELFSKRQRVLRKDGQDIYIYDYIPPQLKVQVIQMWNETLGNGEQYQSSNFGTRMAYETIVDILCREYGVFRLPTGKPEFGRREDYLSELANFLLQEDDAEKALDVIELSFQYIDRVTRNPVHLHRTDHSERANAAIQELNTRFRQHGIGYQFEGEIVRVDSQFIHAETVKPALALLRSPNYCGAEAEFLTAHEHYRHGRFKEALNECLKSLESVMKAICAKRGWSHDPNATAKGLLQLLFDKGLIPSFWTSHFSALRSTLEAGVPTVRNKVGGHGQGTQVQEVPEYLVGYALHLSTSAIVFLVEAEKALP